ncbi:MAG: ABC transporter ATP-binding protein [Clostridiales bacterium]|nr:ABC transporter ATP-binding protein [Clostridiales bacterium]
MSEVAARIENLGKTFGGIIAAEELDFQVKAKDIMGIIGPNGAGKTTVFNLMTGVYPPSTGKVYLGDEDITNLAPDVIVRKGIARTFQNIRLFNKLTVLENVITAVDLHHRMYTIGEALVLNLPFIRGKVKRSEKELRDRALFYLEKVGIAHYHDHQADSLPYGLQRKLEMARALALEPKLLLLDEPAAGMNPEESMELARLIQTIQADFAITILLIEHHMDLVMYLCHHILVMHFGRELAQGSPDEIQRDPAVRKAYLGESWNND